MPDTVEADLEKILHGSPLEGEQVDVCDFTLEDYNEALESQGIQPRVDANFMPAASTTYIVAVVMLNQDNEVLMMQEAKKTCAGKW